MERLTYRGDELPRYNEADELIAAYSDYPVREIINRLADFEDLGRSPEMTKITIDKLKETLELVTKERDAAVADLIEFAKFYRRRTICDFCRYDSEEECTSHSQGNYFINDCFVWRGI